MDKKKARKFLAELNKLQEKYGFQIASNYEEEIEYDYDENPYVGSVSSYLVLVDEEGFEISINDLENGYSTCYYCNRHIDGDLNFCNKGCEEKFNIRRTLK